VPAPFVLFLLPFIKLLLHPVLLLLSQLFSSSCFLFVLEFVLRSILRNTLKPMQESFLAVWDPDAWRVTWWENLRTSEPNWLFLQYGILNTVPWLGEKLQTYANRCWFNSLDCVRGGICNCLCFPCLESTKWELKFATEAS
jgi:hypothetical protein